MQKWTGCECDQVDAKCADPKPKKAKLGKEKKGQRKRNDRDSEHMKQRGFE